MQHPTASRTVIDHDLDNVIVSDYPVASENGEAGGAIVFLALVGRVTATNKIVASSKAAEDGSENPIGLACFAADAEGDPIAFYTSGGFNINEASLNDFTAAEATAAFDRTSVSLIDPLAG